MSLDKSEKEKYAALWQAGSYRSQSALPFARYLKGTIYGVCLEIGCGDGTTLNYVNRDPAVHCYGLDITIEHCIKVPNRLLYEAPVWDMPFEANHFKFTFSTDVLEHLPTKKVAAAINEISRITEVQTIHQIATFKMGNEHLTVQPIEWWGEQFSKYCAVPFQLEERSR